ncbi:MAG: hypothetical protein JWO09_1140 [Bacteroidetes bacterium]|nr:hypothetical protein [Bacteroidota bacterium]
MTEEQLNETIARVILSTKRKSRQYSLYDIATDILALKKEKGGMQEVAKIIGITSGMLNRFLSVFKLPLSVQELVKQREIDRISLVLDSSKLKEEDVLLLAKKGLLKNLSSQDIRTLVAYRKEYKSGSIDNLVEEILKSKNIRASVIRIDKGDTTRSIEDLSEIFAREVGRENLIVVEPNKGFIDIKLTKDGERKLREEAKINKKTLQKLIAYLIH